MAYDTAADIIAAACTAELGLDAVADPYASTAAEQVQLAAILNQCGRELYAMKEGGWQQFIRLHSIDTGPIPASDGRYDLPDDYGAFVNQTGWAPSPGLGMPMGVLTEQQYSAVVASDQGSTTIFVSFLINEDQLQFLPTPLAADLDITFKYMSNAWVQVHGDPDVRASKAANSDDVVMFEPILITTMLALRYKQAKGLECTGLLQKFQGLYSLFSGLNRPAQTLSLVKRHSFPYLDYRNVPSTGFGS